MPQPPHRQHTSQGHLTQHISKPCSCAPAGVRFYQQPAGQPSASPCAARRSVRPAVRSARDPQRSDTISFTFLPCSSSGGRGENGRLSGPSCAIPPQLCLGAQVGARAIPRKESSLQSHAMQQRRLRSQPCLSSLPETHLCLRLLLRTLQRLEAPAGAAVAHTRCPLRCARCCPALSLRGHAAAAIP